MNDYKNLKYNFVFFFVEDDCWKAVIGPSNDFMHVYDRTIEGNSFMKIIDRIVWSYSIRQKIRIPFKSLWFKRMYEQQFPIDKPLCFVYLGGNSIRFDDAWCDYVRLRNPENRQVVIHGDLIAKKIEWNYENLRSKVDLCITYDKDEAEKYGIHYFQELTYSKLIQEDKAAKEEYEVYFLASAKDRLKKIMETYHYLHDNGVSCRFILVGVPKKNQIPYDGIEYSKGISYEENLRNVINSRCVLELIQGGSSDITLRTKEAIAYGKRLITDCKRVNPEFFNPGQLQIIDKAEDIDISMIKADYNSDLYPPQLEMNTINRLFDIQKALENE